MLAEKSGDARHRHALAAGHVDRALHLAREQQGEAAADVADVEEIAHLRAGSQAGGLALQEGADDHGHQALPRLLEGAVGEEQAGVGVGEAGGRGLGLDGAEGRGLGLAVGVAGRSGVRASESGAVPLQSYSVQEPAITQRLPPAAMKRSTRSRVAARQASLAGSVQNFAVLRGPGEVEQMARADRREGGGERRRVSKRSRACQRAGRLVERAAGEAVDLEAEARQRRQRLAADVAAGAGDEDAGHRRRGLCTHRLAAPSEEREVRRKHAPYRACGPRAARAQGLDLQGRRSCEGVTARSPDGGAVAVADVEGAKGQEMRERGIVPADAARRRRARTLPPFDSRPPVSSASVRKPWAQPRGCRGPGRRRRRARRPAIGGRPANPGAGRRRRRTGGRARKRTSLASSAGAA